MRDIAEALVDLQYNACANTVYKIIDDKETMQRTHRCWTSRVETVQYVRKDNDESGEVQIVQDDEDFDDEDGGGTMTMVILAS